MMIKALKGLNSNFRKREEGMQSVSNKETKERSSRQTPFTIKPKQLALKKQSLTPKKYFPN